MSKVKVNLNLSVIVEGDFKDWEVNDSDSISDAVEEWVMNSDPPALKLVCEDNFKLTCGEGSSLGYGTDEFTIYGEDITSIKDLTDELEEVA